MMQHSRRLQLLKNPTFSVFALSCILVSFGAGLSYVSLSWLTLQLNNSVGSIAILMLCFWLPNVLLGPFLGVLTDRYSRKGAVIFSSGLRAIVLLSFAGYMHAHVDIRIIYFLMFCLGVCFCLYWPATVALIREVVEPTDLLYANSVIDIAYEAGNVLGMGSAGLLIAWMGQVNCIFLNGIVFLVCTLLLMTLKIKHIHLPTTYANFFAQWFSDFKLGMQYLLSDRRLWVTYTAQLLILASFVTTPVLIAPFARDVLHASVEQFGHINASLSIGVIVGGIFVPIFAHRFGLWHVLILLCIAMAIFFSLFSVNTNLSLAQLLYFGIGITFSSWPLIVTRAQHLTQFDYQARIQSVFNSLSGVIALSIFMFLDFSSHHLAIRILYGFEVLLGAITVCLVWRYRRVFSG